MRMRPAFCPTERGLRYGFRWRTTSERRYKSASFTIPSFHFLEPQFGHWRGPDPEPAYHSSLQTSQLQYGAILATSPIAYLQSDDHIVSVLARVIIVHSNRRPRETLGMACWVTRCPVVAHCNTIRMRRWAAKMQQSAKGAIRSKGPIAVPIWEFGDAKTPHVGISELQRRVLQRTYWHPSVMCSSPRWHTSRPGPF